MEDVKISGEEEWKDICPKCRCKAFDNHDCTNCGYGISLEARKIFGKLLKPKDGIGGRRFGFID